MRYRGFAEMSFVERSVLGPERMAAAFSAPESLSAFRTRHLFVKKQAVSEIPSYLIIVLNIDRHVSLSPHPMQKPITRASRCPEPSCVTPGSANGFMSERCEQRS